MTAIETGVFKPVTGLPRVFVAASITDRVPAVALSAYTHRPSGDTATPPGCVRPVIVVSTAFVEVFITATEPPVPLLT